MISGVTNASSSFLIFTPTTAKIKAAAAADEYATKEVVENNDVNNPDPDNGDGGDEKDDQKGVQLQEVRNKEEGSESSNLVRLSPPL